MTNNSLRAWQMGGIAALVTAAVLTTLTPTSAATSSDCSGAYRIDKALPNGARWTMCWENRLRMGLVVERVTYTPRGGRTRLVLSSAALAQIHVPYDSGATEFTELGAFGFWTAELTPEDCPGGELRPQHTKKLLCVQVLSRGYAYNKADFNEPSLNKQLQGHELVLFTATPFAWYTYIVEWRFADDGAITARFGATGSLSPDNFTNTTSGWPIGMGRTRYAENHSHNVFWRLDFDVAGWRNDIAEQYDFIGSGSPRRTMRLTAQAKETSANIAPMRFWRVVDGRVTNADRHRISWEVDLRDSDQYRGDRAHAYTHHDLYVTQYHACEQLAADNADGGCRDSVDQYVNAEPIKDIVVWVQVGFHHVPRDEDEDPMPIHWQGFRIIPRDITATNPLP